jgi:hypothetical protein
MNALLSNISCWNRGGIFPEEAIGPVELILLAAKENAAESTNRPTVHDGVSLDSGVTGRDLKIRVGILCRGILFFPLRSDLASREIEIVGRSRIILGDIHLYFISRTVEIEYFAEP